MKKRKNKSIQTLFLPPSLFFLFSLISLLSLFMAFPIDAIAAEGCITFRGKTDGFDFGDGSIYTASDLFDRFKGVMPGDKLAQRVEIQNQAGDCEYIKLYMKVLPHDDQDNPLSPSVMETEKTAVNMADFLKQLSMRIYNGGQLIYESTPESSGALSNNLLLGSLSCGKTLNLTVELDVPPTLGNAYANRIGEVDWVFLAEAFTHEKPDDPLIDTGQLIWPIPVFGALGLGIMSIGIFMIGKRKKNA